VMPDGSSVAATANTRILLRMLSMRGIGTNFATATQSFLGRR
jgi:hypothetical protein